MFGRIARGGGRINIGRKGGWNVKRAMLCLLSIHYAYEKQTHKGEELFKRTKRVSWCLKGLQKSLIIETFCSSRIWREYGLFTFVQVYMHVQLFRALPVCCWFFLYVGCDFDFKSIFGEGIFYDGAFWPLLLNKWLRPIVSFGVFDWRDFKISENGPSDLMFTQIDLFAIPSAILDYMQKLWWPNCRGEIIMQKNMQNIC